ncbi:MAG: tRNA (adenosine(37)-N6)-threonylcarbamoyltransferase complex transferase subunit TsaD [Candidatus Dependentiae bacterium]|nr:tRNA (adenosine(37)-N6)-threonylcarbamoyltransferase complex transferase subunit TsaD [Candidatus Dependentiae bacterium]
MKILGIETSCDETAAAVIATERAVLSNVLFSQIELHQPYGGVVPELASRSHIERIPHIVEQALHDAQTSLEAVDAIAVTNRPGLPGSLLVGLCFAKALAFASKKPLVAVDHVHAHALSPLIERPVPFPHLCLTASGGHTTIFRIAGPLDIIAVGTTQDDAAGEAFDKIAKLLNLGYPGGPIIERLARSVDFHDFFHYPRLKSQRLTSQRLTGKSVDFSFSGLKTAVLYDLVERGAYDLKTKIFDDRGDTTLTTRVASSLLVCIGDIMVDRMERACGQFSDTQALTFAGGVACNRYLAERLAQCAAARKLPFFTPARQYCTDNGAMVAFAGAQRAQAGQFAGLTLDIG